MNDPIYDNNTEIETRINLLMEAYRQGTLSEDELEELEQLVTAKRTTRGSGYPVGEATLGSTRWRLLI